MQLIAFITERVLIERILGHLGEPGRAPRMAPISGRPGDGNMTRQDDRWAGRSRDPDPPVDVMPDYENRNQEIYQDLVWQARTLQMQTDFKAASMLSLACTVALAPGRYLQVPPRDGEVHGEGHRAPNLRGRGLRGVPAGHLTARARGVH
jgi:hypothetical protein